MPKNLFQDMVRVKRMEEEKKRPPLPRVVEKSVQRSHVLEDLPKKTPEPSMNVSRRPSKSVGGHRHALWFVALISIVFFMFALTFLFSKAEVTINPKEKEFPLNKSLVAVKEASGDVLPFDLVIISGEEEKTVNATSEKEVSESARGKVIIYNTFSSTTQRLDIDTRLEGSNGKIYKTEKAVTVPGMKGTTPGSIEVGVYAFDSGEAYNSGPLDFTIVGFKGGPKYSKFYARSKGDLAGGFVGKTPDISEEDRVILSAELKSALEEKLRNQAMEQIPQGFILFEGASLLRVNAQDLSFSTVGVNSVAKVSGTFYGILFEEDKLTEEIVKNNIDDSSSSDVYVANIKDLSFTLTSEGGASDLSALENINFNLSGDTKIVWKVDTEELTSNLLGKSKAEFSQVLASYQNIESANSKLSPFWKRSFPDKSGKIKIVINYPE